MNADSSISNDQLDGNSVAIVGLAGRFPAARTASELWSLLKTGREATQWLSDDELRTAGASEEDLSDPDYVRASLVLPDMEMFDAEFFGFSKRDAAVMDPQHRHFLECAWEALEDAGHMPESFAGAIGVFAGCGMQAYLPYNLLTNPDLVKSMGHFLLRHTGNDKDFLTTRLSYLLDLKGPSMSIQTACSTSLVAVHVAAQSLLSGECDMALAGGVSIELPHRLGYRYAAGEIMSPDGHCRAFDENANGTLFGSGAGVVVLRRLADAVRDRDNIYAVIRGSAVNNDGSQKAGYLAPSVDGQARAAVEALAVAGVDAASVSYIEAHGTGTPVGDPIEVAALSQAYAGARRGSCGIGSLKTNIGHLDTAAGVASLIKVSLALRHELIPATLNFSKANSRFDLEKSPFYVMDLAKPWLREHAPRRAAINSLGVGGTNAHVIIEEPPALPAPVGVADWQVLTLSARTSSSLEKLKTRWHDFLSNPPASFRMEDAAYTTQVGRKAFDHRCAIVAHDTAGAKEALSVKNHACLTASQKIAGRPAVVLMFPGGGAHYPGAGRDLLAQPAFRSAVDACFSVMPAGVPADLRDVMFTADQADPSAGAKLEQPRYAMPALFTLEYAIAKLWLAWGVQPTAVMGHSAGEYAAACLAGVMSLADSLSIVVLRGELFESVPAGAMLSVDLSEAELQVHLVGLELDIAAVNAPDLCMASGAISAIVELERRLSQHEIESRRLRINVAAHSRLLDGVLEKFGARLAQIRLAPPTLTFISNLSGAAVEPDVLTNPQYWVRHLRECVRFADGLATALALPDTVLIEAGPGQGLCALARQNCGSRPCAIFASTGKAQEKTNGEALMLATAGALWARGLVLDWPATRGAVQPRRTSLPTYAFDHQRHWIEPGRTVNVTTPALTPSTAAKGTSLKRLPAYDDWFSATRWSAAPPLKSTPASSLKWLVFGSRSALTSDVANRIADCGGRLTLVAHADRFAQLADGSFTLSPDAPDHFTQLFDYLDQTQNLPDHVLHMWSLDTIHDPVGEGIAGQALSFDSLLNIGKVLQVLDLTQTIELTVVTAGSKAVRGEVVPHPERALALGPCRVIPRELPNITTRLIDLSPVDFASGEVSQWIVAECQESSEADCVAYRDGARWTARLEKTLAVAEEGMPRRMREGGVYLISGGLGDIALDLAYFLAVTMKARLALVSRRTLPPRTQWKQSADPGSQSADAAVIRRLLACEKAGGQVLLVTADVAEQAAMTQVVSICRAHFGAINGVFHAAGVLEDGLLATKDTASIQRVLSPKAVGAQVLHRLLPPGDLDFFAVFSSTSVYVGGAGQIDYVAANAYLDALAASRPDGLAIHWGIWGDRGMAARAYGAYGAYGAPGELQAAPGTTHPLLGVQVAADDGAVFESVYSVSRLWVLSEHRVGGHAVLPGTAYIEIASAAMAVLHPGMAIEIKALSFEAGMVFQGDGARRVQTQLRRTGEGYDLRVRSRAEADGDWLEHACCSVGTFAGALASATPPSGPWQAGTIAQERAVDFGPRWRNIARMQIGERQATAEIKLHARFAGDLIEYAYHPAMTDMAATFGLHFVGAADREGRLFIPLSIDRIRLVAPVALSCISRVELKQLSNNRLISFDASLYAPNGSPIATFEGFSLRGVQAGAVTSQAAPHTPPASLDMPSLLETMLACGIQSGDSHEMFKRILSSDNRDVAVSSMAIADLKRAINGASPKAAVVQLRDKSSSDSSIESEPDFNLVESKIADVWRELLGVETVARDDDFFALGGHSLAAVRLFAKIRKQFAVDLPLATLFQAPTLAALALTVSEAGGIDTSQASAVISKISASPGMVARAVPRSAWSPLVAICKGQTGQRPLFCVHGAGGNVLNFKIISDRLGAHQPFYGLQAQGVDGLLAPQESVEAMAAQYIAAIRTVDAIGPYRLAGYSGGGLIAFEMARQLIRSGAKVEFLAMIDTLSPDAAASKISFIRKLWLMRHWSLKFALKWPARYRTTKKIRISDALAYEKILSGEKLTPELIEFHLFRAFLAVQQRYTLEAYSGNLVLFKAEEAIIPYLNAGASLGWGKYVKGAIRVVPVPGSHITMLRDPGLSVLVNGLKQELAKVDAMSAKLTSLGPAVNSNV